MRSAALLAIALLPVVAGAVLGVLAGRHETSTARTPAAGARAEVAPASRDDRVPHAPEGHSPASSVDPLESLAADLRATVPGDFVERLASVRDSVELSARAARLLDDAFDRHVDGLVRGEILRGLERLGGPAAVEAFARIARREPDWTSAVATRLARLRGEDAAGSLHSLVEAEEGRGELAEAAVRALGFTRTRGYVSWLIELTDAGRAPPVRLAAVESLGRIADEASVEALAGLLPTGEFRLRYAAIRALGAIRSPRARDALVAHGASLPEGREAELVRQAVAAQNGVESRSPRS